MRAIIALTCIMCVVVVATAGGPDAKERRKLIDDLHKQEVDLYFHKQTDGTWTAEVGMPRVTKKSINGLKLLRSLKVDIRKVAAQISDVRLAAAFLKEIADVADLKELHLMVHDGMIQRKDIAKIAGLKTDLYLSFNYLDITPKQVKQLAGFRSAKGLKSLSIEYTDPMPEALAEVKLALSPKKAVFRQDFARHMKKLIKLDEKDDPLTKLRKKKLLAVVRLLESCAWGNGGMFGRPKIGVGTGRKYDRLMQVSTILKDAVADLGNQKLALKIADNYARLIEQVHDREAWDYHTRKRAAVAPPDVEYLYLDAKTWQMKLQNDGKSKR